jgi:predicted ATPase/transcriptional regulator with XRE-family HTH domain
MRPTDDTSHPVASAPTHRHWGDVLRALREARGVTQEGWAARLGVGRRTVQRWERGERAPDPGSESSILAACRELALFRSYDRGPLAGLTLTGEWLQDLLAGARWEAGSGSAATAPPLEAVDPVNHAIVAPPYPPQTVVSNLPAPLTSFVGRERELAAVRRALGGARLLTLTGTGGVGKTRLALRVAEELLWAYPHGVRFVGLAALADDTLVPRTIAAALGVRVPEAQLPMVALTEFLRTRSLLLVLDNCEHLLVACAELVESLLRACPSLEVLTTSREPLGIDGEAVWQVPPLALPSDAWSSTATQRPAEVDAPHPAPDSVLLFLDRARLHRPAFELTTQNAPAVADVCRRLDGIPLALELAAARISVLSPDQIAARLADRFQLLTGGSRSALPRQQTLRATLDWSHDLLTAREQTLLRRLSVFAGGFTLEAAEAICAGDDITPADVLDLLAHLVDKSLVIADAPDGWVRYRLLETVRQYARERMVASGEHRATAARHAAQLLALAEDTEPHLKGADRHRWVARLETEHDNLRSALAWLLSAGEAEPSLRLATALVPFWSDRAYLSEGRASLARSLTAGGPDLSAPRRAKALGGAGMLAMLQMDTPAARALLAESLALWRAAGNPLETTGALGMLAHAVHLDGDIPAMVALCEESLALSRELDDRRAVAGALGQLGHALWHQRQYSSAQALLTEALALLRVLERGQAMWNPFMSVTHVLWSLGNVVQDQADYPTARALYLESMETAQAQGDAFHVAVLIDSFASLALAGGHALRAARLLGAAEAVRKASDVALAPVYRRDVYDAIITTVHAALDTESLTTAWAEGQAMSWERAIAYGVADIVDDPASPMPASGGLRC